MTGCSTGLYVALSITSLALVISLCLNAFFYSLLRRKRQASDPVEYISPYPREQYSEREDEQLQDNPIYGNISTEREVDYQEEIFYEHMNTHPAREVKRTPPLQTDVSYASLDLMAGKKERKKRKGRHVQPKHLSHAQSQQEFLEVEVDGAMPARQRSPMASRHSIYLNSHQMTLESQELQQEQAWETEQQMEREREGDGLMDCREVEAIHEDPARFFLRTNQSHTP